MILSTPNEQFISSNSDRISSMLVTFKELMDTYPNVVLYLDERGWEIFDTRACVPLFRHSFKHVRQLDIDMKEFIINYVKLVELYHRKPDKQFGGKRALNYFRKFYNDEQLKYFYHG